jgi:undecaprenyl-diphosphatase
MAFVFGATSSGFALSVALKALFRRPRPEVVPHLMRAYSSSFPSGHSMISAVVYLTLGVLLAQLVHRRLLKFYFLMLAVLLTVLVGVSRVYLGVHYPTDVLAGWTAGLVWAVLGWLVQRALQRRGQVEREV